MKMKLSYLLIFLLLPAFAEAIDNNLLTFNIQSFPLSLGRLSFILSGLILIFKGRPQVFKNYIFLGFLLIILGLFIASMLYGVTGAITRSLGFLLLFMGAVGNINLWRSKWGQRAVDIFFISLFIYWAIVSFSSIIFASKPYFEMYKKGEVINHHVPGMLVSISSAYITLRFFYSKNGLKFFGFVVFFIALLTCLFIESRSNFLICFLIMMYITLRGGSHRTKQVLIALPILIIIFFSLNKVIQGNEVLQRRFTLNDREYQERTTGMRIEFLRLGLTDFCFKSTR